ncbi:MAG: Peptidase family S41 [Parcubacteria group bacterium GW2011_GWA2_47_7]|nr:MAG: Peptidase family S41 [Parcubacteria group bacterium GW2011_GWA2_47_7]
MVKTEILIDPNDPSKIYAHVILTQFGDTLKNDMVAAINDVLLKHQDVQGFIFDVRGNPGGSLKQVYESVDALVDYSGPFVSIRDNDGIHAYGTGEGDEVLLPQPGDVTNGLPIAVFIDGNSASAAEIFSGALQIFDRSITIGKGTWRKGSVQGIFTLVDGSTMRLNQAEYLIGSPTKWVAVQCVGVSPDILRRDL